MSEPEKQSENPDRADRFGAQSVMAFLQARMGSRRLPGKAMLPIRGQTILERAIRRLRAAPVVDAVAVLTTCLGEDDAVVEEALRLGALVHRGPEQDVLARFYEAGQKFRPDIIIRATADNPLIEIGSLERMVDALYWGGLDWCLENDLPYGAATEAFTAKALNIVHSKAVEVRHREHVTLYIKEHPEEFRVSLLVPPDSLRHPQVRLTVDTAADLAFVDQLIGQLPEGEYPLPLAEYIPLALNLLQERVCKALAKS